MGPARRSRFRSRAAVIVTLAALPILWTPNVVVARKVVGGFRVAIPGALRFAADGWIATGYVFVWQIALTRCRATRPRGSPGLAQTLAPLAGNRGFESTSLQRRVSGELGLAGHPLDFRLTEARLERAARKSMSVRRGPRVRIRLPPAGSHANSTADRFVGQVEPAFGKQLLDVAVAQGEADIEPNRVLDDGRREAVAAVQSEVMWQHSPCPRLGPASP
jgi:hypothetical protein